MSSGDGARGGAPARDRDAVAGRPANPRDEHARRRPSWALAGIMVLALGIRLGAGLFLARSPAAYWRDADYQYVQIAQNLAAGHGYSVQGGFLEGLGGLLSADSRMYSHRSPLYPCLLSLVYRCLGASVAVHVLLQAILSTIVVWLLYLVAARTFDRQTGLVAAAILAVYPYGLYHDLRVFDTPLFEALLAGFILAAMKLADRPSAWGGVAAGVLAGLAVLCRSLFVTFVPVAMLYVMVARRGALARRAVAAALMGVALFAVLTPWLARNYGIHGRPLMSTYGGWNFLLGNSPVTLKAISAGGEADGELSRWLQGRAPEFAGLSETAMDQWFYGEGKTYVREHPGMFARLLAIKVVNYWSIFKSPPAEGVVKNLAYTLSYGPLLVLAVVGLICSVSRWRDLWLLYLLFLEFTASYSLFITVSRHRKPLDAYLAVFAACAVCGCWRWIRARRRMAAGAS